MRGVALMVIAFISSVSSQAVAEPERNFGQLTLSAYFCHVYARTGGYEEESARLFQLGYNSSKEFFRQVESGEISDDYINANVPISLKVFVMTGGPTEEFLHGRIFEGYTEDAYNSIAKEDRYGLPLPVMEWITDSSMLETIAQARYREKNCELLR